MGTVKEQLHDGNLELKRLAAAMNGREFNPRKSAAVEAEGSYSIYFTRALLNYCFGNASEAETLRELQLDDPAVQTDFSWQLSKAAQQAGMGEAALEELQRALSQQEAAAPAT